MFKNKIVRAIFIVLTLSVNHVATAEEMGLSVDNAGVLIKDGKPYRGMGVNYYDAFLRVLNNPADTSYKLGIKQLADLGIPFARVSISGFWPNEFKIYQSDKAKYFRLLDEFVNTAEQNRVGLIVSFAWNYSTIPDLVGENVNQWGNVNSQANAFMRNYVKEVVTRYKNSPAIWGWEFGNELNLQARPGNRPLANPNKGTPFLRSTDDEISLSKMEVALSEFGNFVREIDSYRILISGNAIPRPEELGQSGDWSSSTKEVYFNQLRESNPRPINTISIHLYPNFEGRYLSLFKVGAYELIRNTMMDSILIRKPLLILEFGASRYDPPWTTNLQEEKEQFYQIMEIIKKEDVPLSAVWAYDFRGAEGKWDVKSNDRSYQLMAISDFNKHLNNRTGKFEYK